jgi:hypothetical protein
VVGEWEMGVRGGEGRAERGEKTGGGRERRRRRLEVWEGPEDAREG